MRNVKCKYCGKIITNDTAFCFKDNKEKSNYYCDEKEYIHSINQKNNRDEIYNTMNELLGYEFLTPMWKKSMNGFLDMYDFKVLKETILQNRDSIKYGLEKNFDNEFFKLRYIEAIIKNNIEKIKKDFKDIDIRKTKIENEIFASNDIYGTEAVCDLTKKKSNILEFLNRSDLD